MFNLDIWRTKVAEQISRIGFWLSNRTEQDMPYFLYGALSALTIWPVVEAAVTTNQIVPAISALYSVAGGVGANLVATQIEKWKDSNKEVSEAVVLEWVIQQAAGSAEIRGTLDAMLDALRVIAQAQSELNTKEREWFIQELRKELEQIGALSRFTIDDHGTNIYAHATGDNSSVTTIIQQYGARVQLRLDADELEQQITNYLMWVRERFGTIELRGIKREGAQVMQLDLNTIFVPLEAADISGTVGVRQIRLDEVLKVGRRIVITGGPGSGKSTVLLYIAWALATALAADDQVFAQTKLGLQKTLPLPILVPLGAFAAYLQQLESSKSRLPPEDRTLAKFISRYLIERQAGLGLPEDFFSQLMQENQRVAGMLRKLFSDKAEDRVEALRHFRQLDLSQDVVRLVEDLGKAYGKEDPIRQTMEPQLLNSMDNLIVAQGKLKRMRNELELVQGFDQDFVTLLSDFLKAIPLAEQEQIRQAIKQRYVEGKLEISRQELFSTLDDIIHWGAEVDRLSGDRDVATFAQRSELAAIVQHRDQLKDELETLALQQGVILLLDGLDEIPIEAERVRVREAVEELVSGRDRMYVVVTCRTAAYMGRTLLGKGFREIQVMPLDDSHVEALVKQAHVAIYPNDPLEQRRSSDELLRAIRKLEIERQRFRERVLPRLTSSPLLVRMLLIVFFSERRLPEQRAELYMKATDALLLPDYTMDERVADTIGGFVGGSREVHRELVQYVAFHLHSRGLEHGRLISEEELRRLLQAEPLFGPLVDDFLRVTRLRGTVIEEISGNYQFTHLAFQEFFTARYLAEVTRGEQGIEGIIAFLRAGRVVDSWWQEPILLTAGYLSVTSPHTARLFVHRLAGLDSPFSIHTEPLEVEVASCALAARVCTEWNIAEDVLRKEIFARILDFLRSEPLSGHPIKRAEIGITLAGVGDPRIGITTVNDTQFCFIPAGEFQTNTNIDTNHGLVDIPYNYWLARFPVTNAQFDAFVQADGYKRPEYWVEARAARLWLDGAFARRTKPVSLREPLSLSNHPIIQLSWFEALAFTRWLTLEWTGAGILPANWVVRLPSELEWEKGARGGLYIPTDPIILPGTDLASNLQPIYSTMANTNPMRSFPWGVTVELDIPTYDFANYAETEINATSFVGCFPGGCSPYGCEDMSGNVFEWTSNQELPFLETPQAFRTDSSLPDMVLRGGSFKSNNKEIRCDSRYMVSAEHFRAPSGFRICVTQLDSVDG